MAGIPLGSLSRRKEFEGQFVFTLPVYLCKASDERGPVATFELLEATPVSQAADYLSRAGGRLTTIMTIIVGIFILTLTIINS